jgi:hypothetical protein
VSKPLCFVLMPFHATRDSDDQRLNFASVYERLIVPAIAESGMEALRADEETAGGVFHKRMFERLVVCEYAIADLSTGNPNVFYELGVRHGVRPHSTVLMFRKGWALPLDVALDGALPYPVDGTGEPIELAETTRRLVARLREAREASTDSPVFQLVSGLPVPEVDHSRIDTFRLHRDRDSDLRRRLDDAMHEGLEEVRVLDASLEPPIDRELSTVVALLAAYRSLDAFSDMVRTARSASRSIRRLELVRQQHGWALNRIGRDRQAEDMLTELLDHRPSSETAGLLGRIYKDRWKAATSRAKKGLARKAVDTYVRGFKVDMRDPYPGINALVVLHVSRVDDRLLERLLPVVRFAVDRRLESGTPDYWDHSSDLILAAIIGDEDAADHALSCALAIVRDPFEPETTAGDVRLIHEASTDDPSARAWLQEIIEELDDEVARRR